MKKHLFGSTILPLALVVSLCACGSTPGGSSPSEGTQSAAPQEKTDSAASGGELSIGNDFYIETGTILSDGSIYLVGKEGTNGFCAYVSTDDGDSWSKEELPWADQDVVAITILPDGFMLGTQGQQVVYAPRGEKLKTADLSTLGTVDGISAAYPISTDVFTVSGGKTETFVDKDGQEQETVHPLPFEDMVLRYDGSLVAQWGNGISTQEAGCYASDGTKLYYLDYASNQLCSLNTEGRFFMKNSKKNKEKWLEKVKYTLELGGKSSKTFLNYKSHIIRFLNYFADDIEINKLSEDQIADYLKWDKAHVHNWSMVRNQLDAHPKFKDRIRKYI